MSTKIVPKRLKVDTPRGRLKVDTPRKTDVVSKSERNMTWFLQKFCRWKKEQKLSSWLSKTTEFESSRASESWYPLADVWMWSVSRPSESWSPLADVWMRSVSRPSETVLGKTHFLLVYINIELYFQKGWRKPVQSWGRSHYCLRSASRVGRTVRQWGRSVSVTTESSVTVQNPWFFHKKSRVCLQNRIFSRPAAHFSSESAYFFQNSNFVSRKTRDGGCWFYEFGCVELRKWQSGSTDIDSRLSLFVDYKARSSGRCAADIFRTWN